MDALKHIRKGFKYTKKVLKNVRRVSNMTNGGLKLHRNGPEQRGRVSNWTTWIQSNQEKL